MDNQDEVGVPVDKPVDNYSVSEHPAARWKSASRHDITKVQALCGLRSIRLDHGVGLVDRGAVVGRCRVWVLRAVLGQQVPFGLLDRLLRPFAHRGRTLG